ncbi:fimbria/pilus outer membrane usher protein [Vibrio rhodolitus]|uniref:fimbria/pilus outer membrane usher protein n=1 Tax=Vibrio rhodolitus TaxID=2231649 RepID=UPI000E0A6B07|nr:fimbria/pilus outer membrane usher protein [Vibrio rhodolitus]
MKCVFKVVIFLLATVPHFLRAEQLEFDTSFLQGINQTPKALLSTTGIVEGRYLPLLTVNSISKGRIEFNITKQEEVSDKLCFTYDFFLENGIYLKEEAKSKIKSSEQCFDLDKLEFASVDFDITKPELTITIPQYYLDSTPAKKEHDRGINGFKLNYNLNGNLDSDDNQNMFGSFNSQLNVQDWIVHSDMNSSWSNHSGTEANLSNLYAEYPITAIGADFVVGKGYSTSEFLDGFSFGGIGLTSNRLMSGETASFIPDISGVAASKSQITVRQNGRLIYTETVTPGPFKIDGFSVYGSGDIEVEIKDANGKIETKTYPVVILPSLLRHGYFEYSLAAGKRFNGSGIEGLFDSDRTFMFADAQYGFQSVTLGGAAVIDEKYQAFGVGSTLFLAQFGTLALNGGMSFAAYDDGKNLAGVTLGVRYDNKLTEDTDIQLIAYEYKNQDYVSYSSFTPDENSADRQSPKHRIQAVLSSQFEDFNTSFVGWQQTYWDSGLISNGATVSLSTTIANRLSSTFSLGYSDNQGYEDVNATLSFSLPLNYRDNYHTVTTRFSGGNNSDFAMTTNAGGKLNDDVGYSISVGDYGLSTNLNYDNDIAQLNGGITYAEGSSTLSAGASGSVLWTKPTGLIASRTRNNTIAVIDLNGVGDVKVNGIETNNEGLAVVSLQPYEESNIAIDVNTIPSDVSVDTSTHKLSSTENAIVYHNIDTRRIYKYTLRVKNRYGERLKSGEVYLSNGVYAGAIAPNSMITFSADLPVKIVDLNNGYMGCKIDLSAVSANQGKINEVICE